jgi:hypothetical protein
VRIVVGFPVPVETAFDYLADPERRPDWQSSLRRIEDVTGPIGQDQSWTDVTVPGLRPRMTTAVYDRPRRWAESGHWHALAVRATLDFEPQGAGACRVTMVVAWEGALPVRLLGTTLGALGRPALRADLRRAARLAGSARG